MIDKHVPVVSYGTNLRSFYFFYSSKSIKNIIKKKNVSSSFDNSLLYIKIHSIFRSIIYTIRSFSKRILFHFKKKKSQLSINSRKAKKLNNESIESK